MTERLGLKSWATGALVLAAVTACGNSDADSPPPPPVSSSLSAPTTSSPTSPSPTTPSEEATADATAAMREYFVVIDEVGQDPSADLGRLDEVATSTQLSAIENLLRRQHEQGQRQTGTTVISDLTVQSVSLDKSDPAGGKAPAVVIDVCWDVSQVDVLDRSGESLVAPGRPDTGWTRYTVANYEYAVDPAGGWRVATGQDLERTPCQPA